MKHIEIYDTSLRDGAQMRGISYSANDKLKILQILDEFGIDFVEGGWPGANPKDEDFFNLAKKLNLKNTNLTAFGSTRRAKARASEDTILSALLRAETEYICIVGKSSAPQVTNTLRVELEQNLDMLSESVEYLRSQSRKIIVDAEHFFDGYIINPEYSKKFVERAIQAGAETIVLCDTNGGSLPQSIYEINKDLIDLYHSKVKFGIHAHNDCELAVANSIRAVEAGAIQVQGTINGYGERCGNANLVSIIPSLELKYPDHLYQCFSDQTRLDKLKQVSSSVAEIANINLNKHQPYVGQAAFAHKAGLHVSAMQRQGFSYEHIDPSLVGNQTSYIISEQAGVSNILQWFKEQNLLVGIEEAMHKPLAQKILEKVKELESTGYSFENATASFELLVRKISVEYFLSMDYNQSIIDRFNISNYFDLIEHNVHILNGEQTEATVRIRIGTEIKHSASLGNGPANALDQALRKALRDLYPEVDRFSLTDYKVRIRDSHLGSAAQTIVQVNTSSGSRSWDTIGVHHNIIKASWLAIVDSIVYGLIHKY